MGASTGSLRGEALLALGVAFLETGGLWWLYFGEVAEHSRRQLAEAADPGRLARDAYTYLHLPIVAGIIMVAVANDFLVGHPGHTVSGPGDGDARRGAQRSIWRGRRCSACG